MRRAWKLYTVGALAALTLAGGSWVFRQNSVSRPVPFPEDHEVESVTVAVYGVEGSDNVPEFNLAPEFVPAVLRAFRPAITNDYPPSWDDVTHIRLVVRTTAGLTRTINVPFSGKSPLCFSLDGARCIRAGPFEPIFVGEREIDRSWTCECCELAGALREMNRTQSCRGRGFWLTEHLNNLERSAGLLPPRTEPYR